MAGQFKVTAAAAVVRVGGTERYLYRGASVPVGVSDEDLARLTKLGLLSRVVVEQAATPARAARSRKAAPEEPEEGSEGAGSDE